MRNILLLILFSLSLYADTPPPIAANRQLSNLSAVSINTSLNDFTAGTITAALVGNVTGNISGNASTATAFASNPSDCGSDTYATTIAANGNLTCSSITNASTTATASNTPSTIVLRDGSGNFSAGTITATFSGAVTGNASTATALAANPTDCSSDTYATTIAASGNLTCSTVTNAGLAGSIAASKLVGTDIATVGTITSGTWNGTTIAVANGGTGSTTASGARTNLGLVIGTDVQAAGNYITDLTGDVTATGPGSAAATLATVNSNVGSFGSSTSIPSFTVNGKGLITAASGNAVIAPAGTLTGTTLASNVVNSSLTSVGTITSGTWNGTAIAPGFGGTGTSTAFTEGSVVFSGPSGVYAQDNTNFFWDDTNKRLGLGITAPLGVLGVRGATGVSGGATTVTTAVGGTTFTFSTSVVLLAGDVVVPTTSTGQARVIASGSGTTYNVSNAFPFTAIVAGETYTVYPRTLVMTSNASTVPITVTGFNGNFGVGTAVPETKMSVAFTSGCDGATCLQNGLTLRDSSSGAGWNITDPYAVINFYSSDASPGIGPGVRARIGAVMSDTGGNNSRLGFFSYAALNTPVEAMSISPSANVGIGVTAPVAALNIGGAKSQASWTTTGRNFAVSANTLTDTTGSGTIALRTANSFGTPTFASSNSVTLSGASTIYVAGAPIAGTNTTITQGYGIHSDSGNNRFDSSSIFGGGASPLATVHIGGTKSQASWTTRGIYFAVDAATATDTTGSGTIGTRVGNSFGIPTFASTSSTTLTTAANLYIAGAAAAGTNTTITKALALQIAAGDTALAGNLGVGLTTPTAKVHIDGGTATAVATKTTVGSTTGTTSTDGLDVGADASGNAEIRQRENLELRFFTNNSQRVTIQNDGDVGIGTTSPGTPLSVNGTAVSGTTNNPAVLTLNSTNAFAAGMGAGIALGGVYTGSTQTSFGYIGGVKENGTDNNSSGMLLFGTRVNGGGSGDTTRMVITSAGNVGIGVLAPAVDLTVENDGSINTILSGGYGTGFYGQYATYAARGTQASPTATQSGDILGRIIFQGFDTLRTTGAAIYGSAPAEWGTSGDNSDAPTDIIFATALDTTETLLDRMIITSTGRVGIGDLTPTSTLEVGGHIGVSGTSPAVSACGTTPAIEGRDTAGKVTTGTGVFTTCTITFNTAFDTAPYCTLTQVGTGASTIAINSTSTTALVITVSATSLPINFICIQ